MAFWEFLLQKEGDRSWLPLESSKVEVLEGRYRIVAHASQPQMPIEVRITHTATTEIPPIRRTQKRFSRTNPNGLVVIMPFTWLLPGFWDLRCVSDLMAEMLGEGWQYAVRLQVLPLEVEISSDDWEPDWSAGLTNAEAIDAPALQPPPPSETAAVEDSSSADRPDPTPAPSASTGAASDLLPLSAHSIPPTPHSPLPAPHSPASIRLQLGQDAYVIQTGQPLTLMGQVETAEGELSDRSVPLEALQVRLYDPRTSEILVEERQPLTTRTLPFPFTCRITLPDHFQTYLVLGEIIIYGTTAAGETAALVTQPFSVTTDLHELLEAIADDFSEVELPLPASPEPATLEPLPMPSAPIQFTPSPQQPLPPQLRPADPSKTWQSLDLPSFYEAETAAAIDPALLPPAPAEDLSGDTTGEASDLTAVQPNLEPVSDLAAVPEVSLQENRPLDQAAALTNSEALTSAEAPAATRQSPQPLPQPSTPQTFDNEAPIPDWDRAEPRSQRQSQNQPQNQPTEKSTDSPEDMAFRSLNLQERFWTRLHALAADQELTEWLSTFEDSGWGAVSRSSRRLDGQDAVLTAREVVVEDQLAGSSDSQIASEFADETSGVPVLAIQQPIPIPQLEVAIGDLTVGETLHVQVKLPDLSHPLFVKLWLVDRQNRSVLDGPYWLTDFVPDGFGDLASRYELPVPQGCLELQLEAIAIEMATQRESDKATVARHVIPPNVSNLALDELDV